MISCLKIEQIAGGSKNIVFWSFLPKMQTIPQEIRFCDTRFSRWYKVINALLTLDLDIAFSFEVGLTNNKLFTTLLVIYICKMLLSREPH